MLEKTRVRIAKFVQESENFNPEDISMNLDIPLREAEEFINQDWEKASREIEYKP